MTPLRPVRGFTLIELIVVMVLISILAGTLFMVLRGPMQAVADNEKRARLVDIAETALQRMMREIRLALPYSVRVSGTNAVELLRLLDGGRYRAKGAGRLKFNVNGDTFDSLSTLVNAGAVATGTGSAACTNGTADCLVVYNIGQPLTVASATASGLSANAYLGASTAYDGNVATISAAAANSVTFDNNDLAGWDLSFESPRQRFHVVDTPVSFVCNGGEIHRFSGYAITPTQSATPGGIDNLLVDQVSACTFTLRAPTLTRAGLLTLSLTINDATLGQSVTLLQQVHVDNVP
ncbi:MAG: prepilin-type N-terminal cleavage/methylation domain-containing protein [Gammaproteobacteria bacterium]|nr:prepilin-type N-terminal cleavage/methylation domain-containing protein [Gammaproteobacteria bacterium]